MLRRLLPITEWLPRYDRSFLRGDVAAGVAVTALIVPKNLGYAGIANIPLENGLYAAAAGALIYALFCTSRQISTGPSSALAAVAGGTVLVTGVSGDDAAQLVAAITLVSGLLFLAARRLRMGWIAQFLSKAVVTGFLSGAAIDVVIGELPKLTGTASSGAEPPGTSSGRGCGRSATPTADGRSSAWSSLALILGLRFAGARACRARSCSSSADCSRRGCSTSARTASRSSATCRAGCPRRSCPHATSSGAPGDDRDRRRRAAPDRLLPDGRRRARLRRPPSLPHRRQPGVGRAGHGQRRRRAVPGHAGLDEPLGQLAQRSAGARTPLASLVTGVIVLLTLVVLAPLFSSSPSRCSPR